MVLGASGSDAGDLGSMRQVLASSLNDSMSLEKVRPGIRPAPCILGQKIDTKKRILSTVAKATRCSPKLEYLNMQHVRQLIAYIIGNKIEGPKVVLLAFTPLHTVSLGLSQKRDHSILIELAVGKDPPIISFNLKHQFTNL